MKISKVHRSFIDIAISILESLPKDEVLTQVELAERAGCSRNTLNDYIRKYSKNSLLLNRKRYWGRPEAIKQLRKQTNL